MCSLTIECVLLLQVVQHHRRLYCQPWELLRFPQGLSHMVLIEIEIEIEVDIEIDIDIGIDVDGDVYVYRHRDRSVKR